jgi:hypothetical protein
VIYRGNARDDGEKRRGWFVGEFIPDNMRHEKSYLERNATTCRIIIYIYNISTSTIKLNKVKVWRVPISIMTE